MNKLLFGTGGTPHASNPRTTEKGIEAIRKLGLDCMELEFVQGVKMGKESAVNVDKVRKQNGVELSAHGPYYINLNSEDKQKVGASRTRILQTARIGNLCGATTITFHAAFYMGMDRKQVYGKVRAELQKILEELKAENNNIWVRPETTGKDTQFGALDEILELSQELDRVMPCVDFAHMHARTMKLNSYDEFSKILDSIENVLGKKGLENMHIHMAGIAYGDKGEKNHLNLQDADLKYKELMKALKDHGAKGLVICESPNLEGDALLMKKYYGSL